MKDDDGKEYTLHARLPESALILIGSIIITVLGFAVVMIFRWGIN